MTFFHRSSIGCLLDAAIKHSQGRDKRSVDLQDYTSFFSSFPFQINVDDEQMQLLTGDEPTTVTLQINGFFNRVLEVIVVDVQKSYHRMTKREVTNYEEISFEVEDTCGHNNECSAHGQLDVKLEHPLVRIRRSPIRGSVCNISIINTCNDINNYFPIHVKINIDVSF